METVVADIENSYSLGPFLLQTASSAQALYVEEATEEQKNVVLIDQWLLSNIMPIIVILCLSNFSQWPIFFYPV